MCLTSANIGPERSSRPELLRNSKVVCAAWAGVYGLVAAAVRRDSRAHESIDPPGAARLQPRFGWSAYPGVRARM